MASKYLVQWVENGEFKERFMNKTDAQEFAHNMVDCWKKAEFVGVFTKDGMQHIMTVGKNPDGLRNKTWLW